VYDEPSAVAVTSLRVTNPDQAFKHIEVAWEEGIHGDDAFLVDGTYLWTGDHANADYFIIYINGEARATYVNDEAVEGETYTHLEPQLDAETDYTFVVESYNSDDRLGDDSSSDVSQTTHDRPTITVLNPNGAEIASFDGGNNALDAYDVDISVTNQQFVSAIDVEFLSQDGWEEEDQGENGSDILYENGTVRSTTQIISDGTEFHYDGKVRVTVTDVGNYNDVLTDPDHNTGVMDEGAVNIPEDSDGQGHKQSKDDESDDSFTLAAHTLTDNFSAGWHMFGSPLVPYESAMEVNLSECFGNFGANWIAYDQSGNFDISTLQLNLGEGYYLALSSGQDMFLHGDPVTGDPDNGHLASLNLSSGWTLTSNPLVTTVDKELLTVEFDGEVKEWEQANDAGWIQYEIRSWINDNHQDVPNLNPFGGYWMHTTRDLQVHFTPHLNAYSSREVVDNNDWSLVIAASDVLGDAGSDDITITLKENADNNFVYGEDEIDHPNPMKPNFIDMHIDRCNLLKVERLSLYD